MKCMSAYVMLVVVASVVTVADARRNDKKGQDRDFDADAPGTGPAGWSIW